MRRETVLCLITICLISASVGNSEGQILQQASQSPFERTGFTPNDVGAGDAQQRMTREMAQKANLERQARMKADSERLLKLAQELNNSVGKTNENILSLDVLKEANEIEKLARSVKEKMKGPN